MTEKTTRLQQAHEAVKAAQERLKKAKAAQQRTEARKRAVEAKAERGNDTRRKVLLGAFAMEALAAQKVDPVRLKFGETGQKFGDWLKRDADRALFGLPPLSEPKATPKSDFLSERPPVITPGRFDLSGVDDETRGAS